LRDGAYGLCRARRRSSSCTPIANKLYRARVLKRLGVRLEDYAGANPASRLKHTHGHEAGCGVSLDGLDFSRKARVAQVAVPTGSRASIETGSLGASACPSENVDRRSYAEFPQTIWIYVSLDLFYLWQITNDSDSTSPFRDIKNKQSSQFTTVSK
jgi:hypothetical protein